MKKLMILIALVSTTAFAGQKDLKLFKTLDSVGVGSEQFMSQIHMSLESVQCSIIHNTKDLIPYECSFNDISADLSGATEGHMFYLEGSKAMRVYNMLLKMGATSQTEQGKTSLNVTAVHCNQAVAGVMDGSEAVRTKCVISND